MDAKNTLVSAGVALLVVLGFAYFGPSEKIIERERIIERLGAIPGTEVGGPDFTIGGVTEWNFSGSFAAGSGTTTACTFQSPYSTTTLTHASGQITTATTTELIWQWGNSAGRDSTTTLLGAATIASGALGNIIASTTNAGNDEPSIGPRTYIVLKWGGAAAADQIAGRCRVQLIEH